MPRTFAYARVSTVGQNVANQILEIRAAGFQIEPHRIVEETISGSTAIVRRPIFMKLLDRLESGDVLVVTRLDRLGRNAIDVSMTVDRLETLGVRVHCLQLGGVDLTSPAGKMTMHVVNAVAQFERDLLIERTRAGLKRAKAEGKLLGRRFLLSPEQRKEVLSAIAAGASVSALARQYGVNRQVIYRVRKKAEAASGEAE